MITTKGLKAFSEALNETKIQLDELLRLRHYDNLFSNYDDYKECLYNAKLVPDLYYSINLFDTKIELRFSRKKYYFYIDTLKIDFIKSVSFNDFYTLNNLEKSKVTDKSYYLPEEVSFERAVEMFYKLCMLVLQFYLSDDDNLFYYK